MYWGRHLVKMLKAVDVLSRPGGATIDELAEELGVDRRTVYRIRETLEELKFPLYEDDSHLDGRKRFRFDDNYLKKLPNICVPELSFSLAELVAISFLRGNGRLFRGTEIEHNIEAAFGKLDAFVPDGLAKSLEKVKTLFVPAAKFAKDYSGKEEIINALTDAVFQQRTCGVEYHSFHDDKTKSFRIDPLRFFERDGGLYLFVRTTDYGHIRVLAVERILKIDMEEAQFDYPEDFDPEALLDGAFSIVYDEPIEVKILFSPEVARYIKERVWAKGQKITSCEDGSVILEMTTSGWIDMKRWVMSFGADAVVVEPGELREEIREELGRALVKYSTCL
jgi:predicted DNA-binding transcriptional regulator YafY